MDTTSLLAKRTFHNADQEVVEYSGQPLSWRVSAYVFIVQNGQLLVIQNRTEKFQDIVGGGIEFGETVEEALHREAMEEAGAHIKVGQLLDTPVDWFSHKNGNFYQTIQLFYRAELVGELTTPTEADISWVKFVPFEEVGTTYRLPPSVERIFAEKVK